MSTELLIFNSDLKEFPSTIIATPQTQSDEQAQDTSSNDRSSTRLIERIILSNNLIAVSPQRLSSCPALRVLDLSYNRLSSLPGNLSSAAPRLEKLILNNNRFTDLRFLEGEVSCGSLQSLWIQHNEISALEATARSLQSGCPSLRVLVMHANPCVSHGLMANERIFASAAQLAGGSRLGKSLSGQSSTLSPAQHQQQLFLQQNRGYLPMDLLFLHYCGDLRGLVLSPPNLGYETNPVLSTPGTNEITDGSSVSAERLLSLSPRVVHRVGPAAIEIARSWHQSSAPTGYNSFIRAVLTIESDHAASVAASVHSGTTSDKMNEAKPQRVRIPLAEVRAKVPSRYVQVKGGRVVNNSHRGGENSNNLLLDSTETSEVSVSGRPVTPPPPPLTDFPLSEEGGEYTRGEQDKDIIAAESLDVKDQIADDHVHDEAVAAVASPTADAMNLLADVRRRTAGLLAAVSTLPDVSTLTSLGASGKRATASALALQHATQGGLQSGKKRDDPEISRILKNIPFEGSHPLLMRTIDLFTVDENGTLQSVALSSDGSCSISQEGEVITNASDEPNDLTPAGSVRLRKDGTLIARWPNGATAVEVAVDERSSLALSKWRSSVTSSEDSLSAVGAGGRAASVLKSNKTRTLLPSDTRCFSVSAYSRESTGKSRILSASIDGLGCGTITGTGSTTLALLQLGGSGYHTTGHGKSSPMQRSWDSSGKISVAIGSGYADVPPPQPEEETKTIPAVAATVAVTRKDPDLTIIETAIDPAISAARAMVAAALASAEASNAAVQAIMRSRATMEKFSEPDPRKLKATEELILRKALLKIVSPENWKTAPSEYVIPKSTRSSPVLGGPSAVAFPIGQSLGIAVEIGERGGRSIYFVISFSGSVRVAIKLTLS